MVNLDAMTEALEYLRDTMVGAYANGDAVFLTDAKVDDIYSKLTSTNNCLMYTPGFEKLKFSMFMRTSYSKVVDMKFSMVFKVNGYKTQKCNLDLPRKGFEYLCKWFRDRVQEFLDSEDIIDLLNEYVRCSQREYGAYCGIKYICDYTRKDSVSVSDWGYEKLEFGVGLNVLLKMRELIDGHSLKLPTSKYYSGYIREMLDGFNDLYVHRKIGAKLTESDVALLCKVYKTMNDAIKQIMKNRNRIDVQNIVTCTYINELGRYLVLCNWEVDYRNRKIDITIISNKIYDLGNDKIINRGDIYNKINARVQLPEERSPIIFGDMTVEQFIGRK